MPAAKKTWPALCIAGAAGFGLASAQAATFEVDEQTRLTLGGEVVLNYIDTETVGGESTTEFVDDGSLVILGGERDLGNGITAYVYNEFAYNTLGDDSDFQRDMSVFGFKGDFGEIQIGDSDNVFEDLIADTMDPFENATLAQADLSDETKMITYYSPSIGDFAYRLQARVQDDTDTGANTEASLIAAAQYAMTDTFSIHAGYDSRGSENAADTGFESQDPVLGVAAVATFVDAVEVSARLAQEDNKDGNDIDYIGGAIRFDYGGGSLYGAAQNVSPDIGDSASQVAVGVNYDIAPGLLVFAEYGDFAGYGEATDNESLAVAGLILEY